MYVSLRRYDFVVKVIKTDAVWSENNGCRMSQENVIKYWAALHPLFSDSFSVLPDVWPSG